MVPWVQLMLIKVMFCLVDTDEFPTNVYDVTLAMYEILENGGIEPGE